jgi:nitrate/TMAO reductase-like tetraheme cytochrome c subunit
MRRTRLLRHPVALAGGLLATAGAAVFAALLTAELWGLFDNPYAGLVVFVVVPAILLFGLLLMPFGMWLEHRRLQHGAAAHEWFVIDFRSAATRRWAIAVMALTAVNIAIVLLAGYGSLHYMESPAFCGTTCHTPMHPQFTAWQDAAHSNVTCVQCHIGEGGRAFVHYKLNGVRQLYHVATGSYPRPIPGVADMRPANQVCGGCHWAGKNFGDTVRIKREYAEDESNTETMTILQMYVGGPGAPAANGRAIHWHADPRVQIEYVSTDAERQTIPYVRVTDAQGKVREYTADGASQAEMDKGARRTMDCIDCHNVVAHRIAATPEQAVDRAIADGRLQRGLPFIRREGVRLMKASHPTPDEAGRTIEAALRQFYAADGRAAEPALIAGATAALQQIYRRNVFKNMEVTFGTYPDNLGHLTSSGCFRCHDGGHTAKDGMTISADCEYCHKQIEPRAPAVAQASP